MTIHNIPKSTFSTLREKILAKMDNSDWDFYLTGSRFFLMRDYKNSDYDFFVQDKGPVLLNWLTNNHFEKITEGSYKDSQVMEIYRFGKGNEGIDVQIVRSAKIKLRSQELIKTIPQLRTLLKNKDSAPLLWSAVINYFQNH